ncbi:MAG: MBL fold metallo-hydrolase [Bacteroidota bacterium]|nr:MBL fold metallo-hydrolase [Bacteroidota bacterium]
MKIQFLGAAREVTGSKHLITTNNGKKILLDCGMYQGKGMETDSMNRELGFKPSEIDVLILTHAHIDHCGLIPYIFKEGFSGKIFCTPATRDLCSIMLMDCGHIQEHDTIWFNKKRAKKGLPPVDPIYTKIDAQRCMKLFVSIPYDMAFEILPNIKVNFTNTGHLLGGGVINLEITEDGKTTKIAYTGDIGRPTNRILKSPDKFPQADVLITESTYGDRLHEGNEFAEEQLLKIVEDTCVRKKGKLIIPSFSVGRTQEVVYSLNNFYNDGRLPKIDIFVDSPLSVNATNIFRLHWECFNDSFMEVMEKDSDPFGFNSLYYIQEPSESKELNNHKEPCVIISSSGMMEAGRVKHHLANSISDSRNTILSVGYCSPSTLGAKIVRGDKKVSIFGTEYEVLADVKRLESYSGHGDYKEMLSFLDCQDKSKVQKVFVVHGEYKSQLHYKEKLEDRGFKNIEIPSIGQEFEL